jgi:YidC/Oxa1 family membrane protein insertase
MLVQFPIWIALYQSIRFTLGATPEALFNLSQRLYPWAYLRTSVPLENHFLWLDLGQPDTTLIMAVLVGASTWVQQRLTTPMNANADPQQQSMNQTMLWMMPLLFAFFTLQFPSGLALYWVATNTVGIVLQYSARPENFTLRQIFTLSPKPAGVRPQLQEKPNREPEAAGDETEANEVVEQRPRRRRRRRGRGRRR